MKQLKLKVKKEIVKLPKLKEFSSNVFDYLDVVKNIIVPIDYLNGPPYTSFDDEFEKYDIEFVKDVKNILRDIGMQVYLLNVRYISKNGKFYIFPTGKNDSKYLEYCIQRYQEKYMCYSLDKTTLVVINDFVNLWPFKKTGFYNNSNNYFINHEISS